jgi:hypothetical protein
MRSHFPILFLAAALGAQPDYALDKRTPGTLGATLRLDVTGAPANATMLVMLSQTAGPIPLAIFNPADPRVLSVGIDLAGVWFTLPTGGGSPSIAIATPADANLHGLRLHWQTCTLPGNPFLVDRIGNAVQTQLGAAGRTAALGSDLPIARALAAAFLDRDNDAGAGDVVLAGGGQGSLLGAQGLDSSDVYSFRTMTPRRGANLTRARALHVAVPLADGRVLIAGGVDNVGAALASAELYDPVTNAFTATGAMALARAGHAAARLGDGRVLVAGGTTTLADPVQALANAQASAEIYNPATGTWSAAPAIASRRLAPALTALADGRVLLSGGFEVQVVFGLPIPIGSVAACQVFNGSTWSAAGAMRQARATHTFNTVLLGDGRVLVTGGASSGPDLTQAAPLARAEYYTPAANAWTALPDMAAARATHSATRMPDGTVIVAGGATGTLANPTAIAGVQRFLPASNTWQALPDLTTTRAAHAAVVTPDGTLVVLGGNGGPGNQTLRSIETIRL